MNTGLLILGNQLFDPQTLKTLIGADTKVFMREDFELCTYYKFHKHKLILFLAAMRKYSQELELAGFQVHYEELEKAECTFESRLLEWISSSQLEKLYVFEIEDKFFEQRIAQLIRARGLDYEVLRSPMFLTTRGDFKKHLSRNQKILMQNFYEWQRKRFKLLIEADGTPRGGKWSYDAENRLPLPKHLSPPSPLREQTSCPIVSDVKNLVSTSFADHPGTVESFWLPVDREGARQWLTRFLDERLEKFGPYEDAISPRSDFVYHSVLTPFLNTGLLTPREVISAALAYAREYQVPLHSLEGFVRQVIGWREFIRGVYQNFSEKQEASNFWNHTKQLKPCWYEGTTGIPPLDNSIKKVVEYGYAHHIERLMIVGSLMLLLEVAPSAAHRWFMEMFVDSSDWVMGPNVYGMALFSDGGIFATKPYICGSNYYRKMGAYKHGEWCDGVDGLYWRFVDKHRHYFSKNPRLAPMAKAVAAMEPEKKRRLWEAAENLQALLVI